jgi:hypothetical protein
MGIKQLPPNAKASDLLHRSKAECLQQLVPFSTCTDVVGPRPRMNNIHLKEFLKKSSAKMCEPCFQGTK